MKPLVMIGGGRGFLPRNIIEAVEAQGRALAGYLNVGDNPEPLMRARLLLGDERLLDDPTFLAAHDVVIAVTGPRRRAICEKLVARNASLPVIVHPAATISATAVIGAGTVISAGVIVQQDARVGRFCVLNTSCSTTTMSSATSCRSRRARIRPATSPSRMTCSSASAR
jgi:hypothetical protein